MNRFTAMRILALVCFGLCLGSCSKQQGTINRVQTNLVEKAMFDGEWWYSSTAIDVSYDEANIFNAANALSPFEGSMSTDYALDFNRSGPNVLGTPSYSFPIARIRWVIDENYLFAYRSYELVQGGSADARSPDYTGQPLAVFKIEAHVDVLHDYNSLTGEKTNVLVENTTDRQWYERKYMRVDWSQNLITDFAANDAQSNQLFDTFQREPVPFFIQAGDKAYPASYQPQYSRVQDDPDYRFAKEWPAADKDKVHYMSFVTKEVWSPGKSCVNGGGTCASASVTMRNSFLKVPPQHEYALSTMSNSEFDRFGIFRSHQVTYDRGGQDVSTLHTFCTQDSDCTAGGSCDTTLNYCVGGLTQDRGETDFLAFYMSRQNLYAHSLDKTRPCMQDWECDGRHTDCSQAKANDAQSACEAELKQHQGSSCDPAARLCTIPLRQRELRPVQYRLSPHFPPYLVRGAFEAVAQWNEALMRGQRGVMGRLPIDQRPCSAAEEQSGESSSQVAGDGLCTVDLSNDGDIACQKDNPAAFCYCGSPEESHGVCHRAYDPFESPADAKKRGVPNPYDCYVEGAPDALHPGDYTAYKPSDVYGLHFKGSECMLTLLPNQCDVDSTKPCQELGDLRYQYLTYAQHGGVTFGGIAQPLSDPTTGELIVSLATTAAESVESIGTTASQLLPVLRGDAAEDTIFTGENLRGYYARLGRVMQPISIAEAGGDGYSINDRGRPPSSNIDVLKDLSARMTQLEPKMQQLYGQDGRTAIYSDRLLDLRGTDTIAALDSAIAADANGGGPAMEDPNQSALITAGGASAAPATPTPVSYVDRTPLDTVLQARALAQARAARNMDDFESKLYNSQYWEYWANNFKDYPNAETSLRLQQLYFKSVMTHEVGHAMGLQHNFAGSLDRDNYPDAYFKIARSMPLPAYLSYDDPANGGDGNGDVTGQEAVRYAQDLRAARLARLKAGAGNVMTASIMDYEGDLSNFAGMGRYDAAAVMFSYFGKVEAYTTGDPTQYPGQLPATAANAGSLQGLKNSDSYRRELWSYYRGGEACSSDADCPSRAGTETTVYQPVTQRCVNNSRDPNTTGNCGDGGCLCSNFDNDFQAYLSAIAYRSSTRPAEYSPVLYRYCNDNRVNDLSWCTQNDAGESFQEVIDHYRLGWVQRYPQLYFRNYRASGPSRGYSQNTVVDAVKIYQHLFFRYNFEGATFRQSTGPLGYADQLFASADALNWLGELIAAPDVGAYSYDPTREVYRQSSTDPSQSGDFSLEPGQGFYLWSSYQQGQNGFSRLERAGTFLDKLLAIEAIARRDWGLSYTIDERYYINFYDLFDKEVIDLFGGLILRNPKAYAPRVSFDSSGQPLLQYLSFYRAQSRGSDETAFPQPAIDGSDAETLRDAATIQALSTFPVFYDTSFEQRLLIFKTGSGDGYKIPATHPDGTPTCGYGDSGCTDPDYITYDSDRLHTTFVAAVIRSSSQQTIDEQQLGYQLLLRMKDEQDAIRGLQQKTSLTNDEQSQLDQRQLDLERDETFVNYLIGLERQYGIASYLFTY